MQNTAGTWHDATLKICKQEAGENEDELLKLIKQKFVQRFDQTNQWLQEHLVQLLKQKPGQSVSEYYSLLTEESKNLDKSDKELMSTFLRNLRNDYKLFVLSRKPETLDESYHLAREAEKLEAISNVKCDGEMHDSTNLSGEIKCRDSQAITPVAMQINDAIIVQKTEKSAIDNIGKERRQYLTPWPTWRKPLRCHYCRMIGHRIAVCRTQIRDGQHSRLNRDRAPYIRPINAGGIEQHVAISLT